MKERIRKLRDAIKMTQGDLADAAGVSRHTIINWETGKRSPDMRQAIVLAKALGTSVSYLLGETDDPAPRNTQQSTGALPPGAIPYSADTWITLPVLDPSSIACAGDGNGGIDTLYHAATECISLPKEMVGSVSDLPHEHPYAVWVEGDSMVEAGIPDGCQIAVNPIEEVHDGEAALVCFGENGTWAVKWVYWEKDGSVEIRSATLKYPPRRFDREEIELGLFRVLGKVMQVLVKPKRGI